MTTPPPVNPDVHEIADQAKYAYATMTKLLADMGHRLAELAGTGKLDTEAVWELHHMLHRI